MISARLKKRHYFDKPPVGKLACPLCELRALLNMWEGAVRPELGVLLGYLRAKRAARDRESECAPCIQTLDRMTTVLQAAMRKAKEMHS
jgi:hypothetical protein